jgi:hypothetical protein
LSIFVKKSCFLVIFKDIDQFYLQSKGDCQAYNVERGLKAWNSRAFDVKQLLYFEREMLMEDGHHTPVPKYDMI